MKKILIFSLLLIIATNIGFAQNRTCGADENLQARLSSVQGFSSWYDSYLTWIANYVRNYPVEPTLHRTPVTIPVVVHIVYNNATDNISQAQINSAISGLNTDFLKQNDAQITSRAPANFRTLAANSYIQFKLAKRDPDGNATTGITRTSTSQTSFVMAGDAVKKLPNGVVPWDTKRYLNMWVCDLSGTLMGYATFPADTDRTLEGVVMDHTFFGTTGTVSPPMDEGRTTTHEVAHFFDLYHIWGDANCGDDKVADTPTQQSASSSGACATHPRNSCGSADMFMNYMDYSADNCMCMFTKGQRARMLANLAPGGRRASLAVSNAMYPPTSSHPVDIDYEVFLEGMSDGYPAWKMSLAMIINWAFQQSMDIDQLISQSSSHCSRNRYAGMPNEISDAICGLGLSPEEVISCFSIDGFASVMSTGPIAVLSVKNSEFYGVTISGMVMDSNAGSALLKIKDPMGVGPRMGLTQRGAEYNVDFGEFMTGAMERVVSQGAHVYIVYPPSPRI